MNKALTPPTSIDRKRLRYRSWHRGVKEMDLVMGRFADQYLETLEPSVLAVYADLLDEDDLLIWDWLVGQSAPTRLEYKPLLARLREYSLS